MKEERKYVEAAKNIDRQTLYINRCCTREKSAVAKFDKKQLKRISEQVVMDVMQNSRLEVLLCFHGTGRRFVYWCLQKVLRQKRLRQQNSADFSRC